MPEKKVGRSKRANEESDTKKLISAISDGDKDKAKQVLRKILRDKTKARVKEVLD